LRVQLTPHPASLTKQKGHSAHAPGWNSPDGERHPTFAGRVPKYPPQKKSLRRPECGFLLDKVAPSQHVIATSHRPAA
jgi:hypothetical protein